MIRLFYISYVGVTKSFVGLIKSDIGVIKSYVGLIKYDKQNQQGKAAFNERNPNTRSATRTSGKEPRRTPNKNRTGHKIEHGQVNH
jgi:hypothetical protein